MLNDELALISVDDHLIERPGAFQDRLAARYRPDGPRVIELPDGTESWTYAGVAEGSPGLSAVAGKPFNERSRDPLRFDEMYLSYYDADARCAAMDQDGVHTEVLFPSYSRFAGARFLSGDDRGLALACVRAYNDYAYEEWQVPHPDRLVPLVILPLWDVDLSVQEFERCLARGAHGITMPDSPPMLGLPSYRSGYWNPLLARLQEAGVPVCMHFGASGVVPVLPKDAPQAAASAVFPVTVMSGVTDLLLSSVLETFPQLSVVLSESGLGWIPYLSQRVDQVWEHYRYYALDDKLPETRPSDFMRRNVYSCFIDDPIGVSLRHTVGMTQIMWESDYPHADSLFPNSRNTAVKVLADVPDDEAEMIVSGNARRVFGL